MSDPIIINAADTLGIAKPATVTTAEKARDAVARILTAAQGEQAPNLATLTEKNAKALHEAIPTCPRFLFLLLRHETLRPPACTTGARSHTRRV